MGGKKLSQIVLFSCAVRAAAASRADPYDALASRAVAYDALASRADPYDALSLVPWPQQVTLAASGGATPLSNETTIFFSPAAAEPAALALAADFLSVLGLGVATREASGAPGAPGAGNVLLSIGDVPLPPPPPPLPPPAPGAACNASAFRHGLNYDNQAFADPNGPRTTADAGACCALCAQTANCNFWSFEVDPAVPGATCHWTTLTFCCWMHSSDANATADARYTSGAAPGMPPLPPTGAVPPTRMQGFEDESYSLQARAGSGVVAVGASVSALHRAGVTILQALLPAPAASPASASPAVPPPASSAAPSIPDLDVLDWPLRSWRGLQIDLSSGFFHSLEQLRRAVDLCRMVKAGVLVFHTGAETWMGLAMDSVSAMNETWRHANPEGGCYGGCVFYTADEFRGLVAYASSRGVRMVPHCEATPSFLYNIDALTTRYNPNSTFADFVDEIDHLGPSGFNGTATPRFWNAMRVMLNASIAIFGAGWPGGQLPVLHVGAVLGEGGMDDEVAYPFFQLLQELQPGGISMAFYDGPCASCNDTTHPLYNVRSQLLVNWYTGDYSESPLSSYVANGWPLVSITWLPLYVLGGAGPYSPEETFDFNILVSNNESYFSGTALDDLTRGAMLSTWTMRTPDDLSYARQRLPAMAEKAWQYRGHPVPADGPESFAAWARRWAVVDRALDAVMGPTPRNYECSPDLQCVPNEFGNGTSYQDDCGGCRPSDPPPTPPDGHVLGGRIFLTNGRLNASFFNATGSGAPGGVAGADAACAAQAAAHPAPAWTRGSSWKALLAAEGGCGPGGNEPCRRASVTPGAGDGAVDWPLRPSGAYYGLDGATLRAVANATAMLQTPAESGFGGINQAAGFGVGWTTSANGTCDSFRWAVGMAPPPQAPFGFAVSLGWAGMPVYWEGGGSFPCDAIAFFCVEVLP